MEIHFEEMIYEIKEEMQEESESFEPWDRYWNHRPLRNFPTKTIQQPSEYEESDCLSLACTQTDLPSRKQRDLVREWCALLPTLSTIRLLSFVSRVSQELFEAACAIKNLEGLYIKWSGIKSLEPIARLSKLTHLHIGSSPSAKPIEALCELPKLITLELSNVKSAANLSFLAQMQGLKSLKLSGDNNSIKSLRIQTLKPIVNLINLEMLQIITATVSDESLEPIGHLPLLKDLLLSNQYKMEEVAKLSGRMTNVQCNLFKPISKPIPWMACEKCGHFTMTLLTGKRKPTLRKICDKKRIDKHIIEFKRIADTTSSGTKNI